jgi:hypothetical protein
MTEHQTSVKIADKWLEKLRLQYPDMSFNQIMEAISNEEELIARTEQPEEITKQIDWLICSGNWNVQCQELLKKDMIKWFKR